jgi:xanthine dehydrogenase/oxidase
MAEPALMVHIDIEPDQPGDKADALKVRRTKYNGETMLGAVFRLRHDGDARIRSAVIYFSGLQPWLVRAKSAEAFLVGRCAEPGIASRACDHIRADIEQALAASDPDCRAYKASVAQSLLLRFLTDPDRPFHAAALQGAGCNAAAGATGTLPGRVDAEDLVSGRAQFASDACHASGVLQAAIVWSNHARAEFRYPGGAPGRALTERFSSYVDYITAEDVPGTNGFGPAQDDFIFAEGRVTAYGQPIGLVVAQDRRSAEDIAQVIAQQLLSFDRSGPPITHLDTAISLGARMGDARATAVRRRPARQRSSYSDEQIYCVQGEHRTGAQAHCYLEPQSVIAYPTADGRLALRCASQDLALCRRMASAALNLAPERIDVMALRFGGGFGGKSTRTGLLAAAVAIAAWKLRRPVSLALDRRTDLAVIGKRHPFLGTYTATIAADGKLKRLDLHFAVDGGNSALDTGCVLQTAILNADGPYAIEDFTADGSGYYTNTASNTAFRGFGAIQSTLILETAIEHSAHRIGVLPEDVRQRNLYRSGADNSTPYGQTVDGAVLERLWHRLRATSSFDRRRREIEIFNGSRRFAQQGIAMLAVKFGIGLADPELNRATARITIGPGGAVSLATGAVDMGQGLRTRLTQIVARLLGVAWSAITIEWPSTATIPEPSPTGASTGCTLAGAATELACSRLEQRLKTFCAMQNALDANFPPWSEPVSWRNNWPRIVDAARQAGIDLTETATYCFSDITRIDPANGLGRPFGYFCYAAACAQVEIDVPTGACQILRADIVCDAGRSLHPLMEFGQIQGGFVQGMGNVALEQIRFDQNGVLISDRLSRYALPCSQSIPWEFNVELLDSGASTRWDNNALGSNGLSLSKSTGEVPVLLGASVYFAIRRAIAAFRCKHGYPEWFYTEAPLTSERIHMACLTDIGVAGLARDQTVTTSKMIDEPAHDVFSHAT